MTEDILKERYHELPKPHAGHSLTEEDQRLIHYISDKMNLGNFDLVAIGDNPNWDEDLYKILRNWFYYIRDVEGSEDEIKLSQLFVRSNIEKCPDYSDGVRWWPEDEEGDSQFLSLIMFDTEIPEIGRTRLLPKLWRKRPMNQLNAVKLRDEIKNYLDFKNLLHDKCGMRWHISVPELCLVLGVSVDEWLKYDEPDQIKDSKDYFTSLVLAQGVSMLHDYDLKNPTGVMADMKAHAGLEDISHIKVHKEKKRRNVVKLHKRTETP